MPRTLRALRALLCGVLLSCLLGGDCHWAFSSKTSDSSSRDGGATVIVTEEVTGDGAREGEAVLDPELLELNGFVVDFATREEVAAYRAAGGRAALPLLQSVLPLSPELAIAGGSPVRIWPPERIGEAELAAFAKGLLAANEARLNLPVRAAALQFLDTQVADGVASVRFGERSGTPIMPALAVRFGSNGELLSIDRLALSGEARDKIPDRR